VCVDAYEQYQIISEAITSYLEIAPQMGINLPSYKKYKNQDPLPECPDAENKKLYIYMANTIGDACSKILTKHKEHTNEEAPKDKHVSLIKTLKDYRKMIKGECVNEIELKKYGDMALFFCNCATKWADEYSYKEIKENELQYFEIYYRNCGVAYERYDAAFKSDVDYSETILKNYQEAFYHIVNGTKIRAQRVQSVYHVLLSYLKKYIETKLGIKWDDSHPKHLDSKDVLTAVRKNKRNIDVDQIEYLKLMANVSELAIVNMPLNNIPHVMNGFAYSYILLLKWANNSKVDKAFTEGNSVYYDKIQTALSVLKTLNINEKDDYKNELDCFCKTIMDIAGKLGISISAPLS